MTRYGLLNACAGNLASGVTVTSGSNWPSAVLASAFGPHHDPRKVSMAICVGYFEANEHGMPATLTVTGLVSPKARWQSFEERWRRALRGEGLTTFNARDFIHGHGEFSAGWTGNADRRSRLVDALSRVAGESVAAGASYSLHLADYRAAAKGLPHAETIATPYAVCAGVAMASVLRRAKDSQSGDVTLFVFEDGGIDHQQVRQVAAAEGIDHAEPVQIWPREWRDEYGRRRLLRPFEACDLLVPPCRSRLVDRLVQRASWDEQILDRARLSAIFQSLATAEPVT